ncbi:hypothetical protein Tco_1491203 [Tanacetum coccineum]
MRNKPGIDVIDIDDLYNNLRVYEDEMKRSSSSTSNSQNLAFLSSENTNSTNEVSTASGDICRLVYVLTLVKFHLLHGLMMSLASSMAGGYVDCQSKEVHSKDKKKLGLQRKMTYGFSCPVPHHYNWEIFLTQELPSSFAGKTNEVNTQNLRQSMNQLTEIKLSLGIGTQMMSTDHLIKDCNFHDKKSQEPKLKNVLIYCPRGEHYTRCIKRTCLITPGEANDGKVQFTKVSTAGLFCTARSVSTARPVSTVRPFALKKSQTSGAIRPIYLGMDNIEDHSMLNEGKSRDLVTGSCSGVMNFSRKVTPLFDSMLVQQTEDEGEALERPSDSQPIPSPAHPVKDQPQSQTIWPSHRRFLLLCSRLKCIKVTRYGERKALWVLEGDLISLVAEKSFTCLLRMKRVARKVQENGKLRGKEMNLVAIAIASGGGVKDERQIKELNKDKKKRVIKETPRKEDTAKIPIEQEVTEQGDLKIMMESLTEENDQGDFWNNQQEWEIVRWRLYEACGVFILELKDGIVIYMLVERRYPLSRELLQQMLDLGLEVEEESNCSLQLVKIHYATV